MNNTQKRWWDIITALSLLAALMILAFRLNDTHWADGLRIVIPLSFFGTILGLALGASQFDHKKVWWMGLVFTLFFIPWQIASLAPDHLLWGQRVNLMADAIWLDIKIFIANRPLSDSFLFILLMGTFFWLNSLATSYLLSRYGKPWVGLIAAGASMAIFDVYHPALATGGVATAIFAVLSFVLVTRIYYLKQAHQWQEDRVAEDNDTGTSLVRVTFLVVVILVFLSWKAPSVVKAFVPDSPENVKLLETWQTFRHRLENATAPLRGSVQNPVEYFGDNFSLGTGSILTDQTIFTVTPSQRLYSGLSFYWRMRSYDYYQNGQWTSNSDDTYGYTSGVSLVFNQYADRSEVQFQFTPSKELSMLYSPGLFVASDHNVNLLVDRTSGLIDDVTSVLTIPNIKKGQSFSVTSDVSTANISDLQAAGTNYPEWVTGAYLQLPSDFSTRIQALAQSITAGLVTPYEKADAITNWLRTNIQYSATIPNPPAGQDPIEWILFDEKQAFCNYYASAEVLMLRSVGVPARWVVGYAQGEQITENGKMAFRVRDKDRHAWPEVFFPGLGWVEFEPTALQPSLSRPTGDSADSAGGSRGAGILPQIDDASLLPTEDPHTHMTSDATSYTAQPRILYATLIILGTVILAIVLYMIFVGRFRRNADPEKSLPVVLERTLSKHGWNTPDLLVRWSYYTLLSPIEKVYYWLYYVRRLLGLNVAQANTPGEQIAEIQDRLPGGRESAALLLREYEKGVYSPHPANVEAAWAAMRTLWRLAFKYRWRRLTAWFTRYQGMQQA